MPQTQTIRHPETKQNVEILLEIAIKLNEKQKTVTQKVPTYFKRKLEK